MSLGYSGGEPEEATVANVVSPHFGSRGWGRGEKLSGGKHAHSVSFDESVCTAGKHEVQSRACERTHLNC